MERVEAIEGSTPVIIVTPHGPDDKNTDLMAEMVASEFGAFAVINRGWMRSASVDPFRDMANCNNIRHLHSDVVREEFLEPVMRFKNRVRRKYNEDAFILILHGCSDKVMVEANDHDLDMIVGFGDGFNPSYSCDIRFKDAFVYNLANEGFGVYEGSKGGKYSGHGRNNLNQLFARWYPDPYVNSLQLEIVHELRSDEELLELTVRGIVSAIDSMMVFDDTTDLRVGARKI